MNTERRSAGWVSTLVALVVLVVVGFLCGALAGFLWEEPGLVLAYLSGKTEPVEFSEPAPVAAEPPGYSESAELAPDAHAKFAAQEAPLAERPPSKPAVAAAPREEPLEVAPEVAPAAPKVAAKPAEKKTSCGRNSSSAGSQVLVTAARNSREPAPAASGTLCMLGAGSSVPLYG